MEHNFYDEENNVENLSGKEAIAKLKELDERAYICMFTTYATEAPMPARHTAVQAAENDGKMYFFSATDFDKNREKNRSTRVQLYFANTGRSEYLNVFGTVEISNDREKIKELWSMWAKLIFTPTNCECWDTKHNKILQLLKIATSMVTGKTMDDSVEGELKL